MLAHYLIGIQSHWYRLRNHLHRALDQVFMDIGARPLVTMGLYLSNAVFGLVGWKKGANGAIPVPLIVR